MNFDVNVSQSPSSILEALSSVQSAVDSLSQQISHLAQAQVQTDSWTFLHPREAWRHSDTPSQVWASPLSRQQVFSQLSSFIDSNIEAESLKLALDVNLQMLSFLFEPNISLQSVFLKQFSLCCHLIEAITFYVNHNRTVAPQDKYGRSFPRVYFEGLDTHTADLRPCSLIDLRDKAGHLAGKVPLPKKKNDHPSSSVSLPFNRKNRECPRVESGSLPLMNLKSQTPPIDQMNFSLSPPHHHSDKQQAHTFPVLPLPPRLVRSFDYSSSSYRSSYRENPFFARHDTHHHDSQENKPHVLHHAKRSPKQSRLQEVVSHSLDPPEESSPPHGQVPHTPLRPPKQMSESQATAHLTQASYLTGTSDMISPSGTCTRDDTQRSRQDSTNHKVSTSLPLETEASPPLLFSFSPSSPNCGDADMRSTSQKPFSSKKSSLKSSLSQKSSLAQKPSLSFSSEETVCPFSPSDRVSGLLRSYPLPKKDVLSKPGSSPHRIRFSSSIRVYRFKPDSPVNFSFSPKSQVSFSSPPLSLSPPSSHPPKDFHPVHRCNPDSSVKFPFSLSPSKSQISLSSPPSPLSPSPHPPKDFHSVIAWLNARDYEPPIDMYVNCFFLPQGPHQHRSSHLHVPLKPIVQTTLNYEVMKELSLSLSSDFSHTYHFLLSILTDNSLFQSLFVKKIEKLLPGRPSKLSRKDVKSLTDWGVLVPRPRSLSSPFFHFGFKVAKSDPKWTRFILDCTALNESQCDPPPFSLPPPICIISVILSSLCAFIADFCSWFFQHYVSSEVASFFSLRVGSSPYLCTRLAQGWKFSPVTGQSSSSVLAHDPMCPDDPRSLVWIDDLFFGDVSRENLDSKRQRFLQRCERAGATIGTISEIVTKFSYVGMDFDLEMKRWRVKSSWVEKFFSLLSSISSRATPHIVWVLLGGFMWFLRCSARPIALLDGLISQAISLSPRLINSSIGWSDPISLWPSASDSILSLSSLVRVNAWRTIPHALPFVPPIHHIFSDASLKGGAAVFDDKVVWKTTWDFTVTSRDIFYLEALAWAAGVRTLSELGVPSAITVVDNEGLFHALLKSRAKDVRVGRLISDICEWAEQRKFLLYAGWIDTKQMPADAPSRGEPLTQARPILESIRVSKWPYVFACDA